MFFVGVFFFLFFFWSQTTFYENKNVQIDQIKKGRKKEIFLQLKKKGHWRKILERIMCDFRPSVFFRRLDFSPV